MFNFLTKKPLWVNILFVLIMTSMLVLLFFGSLDFITKHGKNQKVPSVVGKNVDEAKKILELNGFNVEVVDSLYFDTIPKLAVLKQSPEGEAVVKENRTIYLTVNRSHPPLVEMPNLVGFSLRNAEMYLENLGLHLGDTSFRPDWTKNAVLEQLYNGEIIKPGTKIYMGSAISFVLGNGIGATDMAVPDLVGKQFSEVRSILRSLNINFVTVIDSDVRDTLNAFIYKQNPNVFTELIPGQKVFNKIKAGQSIDLWLSVEQPVIDSSLLNIEVPE